MDAERWFGRWAVSLVDAVGHCDRDRAAAHTRVANAGGQTFAAVGELVIYLASRLPEDDRWRHRPWPSAGCWWLEEPPSFAGYVAGGQLPSPGDSAPALAVHSWGIDARSGDGAAMPTVPLDDVELEVRALVARIGGDPSILLCPAHATPGRSWSGGRGLWCDA